LATLKAIKEILKNLEKEYDDIEWDCGVDDPRLANLADEINYYRKLNEDGVVLEPDF
jgi:hypothetical protein